MYPNFSGKKYNNEARVIRKRVKKINTKVRLMPEIKTVAIQLPINNIDCPKSGWSINNIITELKSKKLKKYFSLELSNLSSVNILTVIKINNGFNISIGCNLKKKRSSHLLAPFTSTPIIGTNAKNIKAKTNEGATSFSSNFVLISEIEIIIIRAKKVKIKCLVKKK